MIQSGGWSSGAAGRAGDASMGEIGGWWSNQVSGDMGGAVLGAARGTDAARRPPAFHQQRDRVMPIGS